MMPVRWLGGLALLAIGVAGGGGGGVEFPLLEASGATGGDVIAIGDPGAGTTTTPPGTVGVVVKGRDLLLLGGPTPRVRLRQSISRWP